MSLGAFIAGPYNASFGSALGVTEDGFDMSFTPKGEEINQTDLFGMTLVEIIMLGGDWAVTATGLEYTKMVGVLSSWATLGTPGAVSRLASSAASALVMSAAGGTATPASFSASRAILSPNNASSSWKLTSKLRRVPVRMTLLPSDALVHFVTA